MERGLLWLPLLGLFIWLAWAGWNEYQKVETYRLWATQFDRSKYDIYSVLGQKNDQLTWGIPTRKGPIQLVTVSLRQLQAVRVLVKGHEVLADQPPSQGKALLELTLAGQAPIAIPFTEPPLALQWANYLHQTIARLGDAV